MDWYKDDIIKWNSDLSIITPNTLHSYHILSNIDLTLSQEILVQYRQGTHKHLSQPYLSLPRLFVWSSHGLRERIGVLAYDCCCVCCVMTIGNVRIRNYYACINEDMKKIKKIVIKICHNTKIIDQIWKKYSSW